MKRYWKIAPGEGGFLWREQKLNGCIAIGWSEIGDARGLTYDDLYKRFKGLKYSDREAKYAAGQLDEFINNVSESHKVVASTSGNGIYAIGTVTGHYEFNNELEYKHSRKVQWETTFWSPVPISELELPKDIRNKFHGQSSKTIRDLSEKEWTTFLKKLNKFDTPFRNLGLWGGMVQSPEYENEVMILFSHMLQYFKMRIVQFGTRFPDAIVELKRGKKWEKLKVEFELYSSNFECHLPDCKDKRKRCDLIICWKDDWKHSQRDKFEVIELKEHLEKFL